MMWSIQTSSTIPLASVKPLERLLGYRAHCLEITRNALSGSATQRRERSPITGAPLTIVGDVDGLKYGRCPDTGSLFLVELSEPRQWANLLKEISRYRQSPNAFHAGLAQVRSDHVYAPKLEWIQNTLRLQERSRPRLLEVTTPPSEFTAHLASSELFAEVVTTDEMALAATTGRVDADEYAQVAVMLESLDRVHDPAALLQAVRRRLSAGGLLFVTALVASGFDMAVLGLRNLYLYPPDRTNCFTLSGLSRLLEEAGFSLLEVSTPGVLDVEIVSAHLQHDPDLPIPGFERQLVQADQQTKEEFQAFLQQRRLSSFARIVAKRAE